MHRSLISLWSLRCKSWMMSALPDSFDFSDVVLLWLVFALSEDGRSLSRGCLIFMKPLFWKWDKLFGPLHDLRFFEHLTFSWFFYALLKSLWFWSKAVVCLLSTIATPEQTKSPPYNCSARQCFVWVLSFRLLTAGPIVFSSSTIATV